MVCLCVIVVVADSGVVGWLVIVDGVKLLCSLLARASSPLLKLASYRKNIYDTESTHR